MTNRRYATSPEDLPTLAETASRSGLETMQMVLDGRLPGPPIAQALNYWITAVDEGMTAFEGAPEFQYTNPMGTVHGGWYGTLLDSCMACAVMTRVPQGHFYTTLEYKVNILRPIRLGQQVCATGWCQHAGRSTGIANGEIRGVEDDKLYATGSTTCIIMKAG